MNVYRVRWEIDLEATTPEEAADLAREIQLDPESIATLFHVKPRHAIGWADVDVKDDDGCPVSDPDCMGNAEDCHDACEAPDDIDSCGEATQAESDAAVERAQAPDSIQQTGTRGR